MVTRLKYAVTLAIALLFSTSLATAQGNYGGSMDAKEHGYQHGIETVFARAGRDVNNNVRPSFDSEDYRRADLGYED